MGSDARRRQSWWRWVCACGVASALGCGQRAPECRGQRCEEVDVHVLTWWPSTNNGPATPLKEAAEAQPNVREVLLRHRPTKNAMMADVQSLLLGPEGQQPTDTFLANAGRDVLRWTPCGGEDGGERVLRLDEPGRYPALSDRFAPEVLAGVTCCADPGGCDQPGIYALPLGMHRINHIFFNVARFEGCDDPATVTDRESLLDLLECLGKDGQRVISMPASRCPAECAAGDTRQCLECRGVAGESLSFLLESLLLLVAHPRDYQSYWRGESWQSASSAAEDDPLSNALGLLQNALRPHLNNCPQNEDCEPPPDATAALEEVATGTAAFLVMPDWFMLDVQRRSDDVQPAPFPGTGHTFLFMTDVFALPLVTASGAGLEPGFRWLDTLLDPQVQDRFAAQKHALPALGEHSQLQLLPSLEAQLPVSVQPALIRATLNDWLQGEAEQGLADVMAQQFEDAQRQGTLRVAPCNDTPCGAR